MKVEAWRCLEHCAVDFHFTFNDGSETKVRIDEHEVFDAKKYRVCEALGRKLEEQVRDGTAKGKKRWEEACQADMTTLLTLLSSR